MTALLEKVKGIVSAQTIIESVGSRLQHRHPGGATLTVVAEGVRQEEDYWVVPVRPSHQPANRGEYYSALAEVETEMLFQENILMLMAPTPTE